MSTWDHLHLSIPLVVNLGLSGQPFSGPDIGGFFGNATSELFGRWMGFGALLPFSRAHTSQETGNHEPWSFGDKCERVCRLAITRRYTLMPYIYTLFYFSCEVDGLPVVRPLFFADVKDKNLREEDKGFLLGGSILVQADVFKHGDEKEPEEGKEQQFMWEGVELARKTVGEEEKETKRPGISKQFHLPTNKIWQKMNLEGDLHSKEDQEASVELPTLFQVDGSIVVISTAKRQFMGDHPSNKHQEGGEQVYDLQYGNEELKLNIVMVDEEQAEGYLYEDDGESHGFQQGEFLLSKYKAQKFEKGEQRYVKIFVEQQEGNWRRPAARQIQIQVDTGEEIFYGSGLDGSEIIINF
jgi:alpha-glucosidase